MYIVTTSKRIHQITALIFVCLAFAASFSIYRYYQGFYAEPEGVARQLLEDASSETGVSLVDIDVEALKQEASALVFEALAEQLKGLGVPNAAQSAELLLPQATRFLEDESQFKAWLNQQVSMVGSIDSEWRIERLSLTEHRWSSANGCLRITREDRHWQLVSLRDC